MTLSNDLEANMEIKIKILSLDAVMPKYQTEGAAGFDLHSVVDKVIRPKERVLIETGLAFEVPYGFEVQIRPRSGLALKYGISVLNSPGTIDSDYRGEIKVLLINHSNEDFKVKIGDRIAQAVFAQVTQAHFVLSEDLSQTLRNQEGFGSTGI